jgi:AcrR family transcriptional regulator
MAMKPKTQKPKNQKTKARKSKADKPEVSQRIIETVLVLAAEKGWAQISLADIAAASKLTLPELYAVYPSKTSILFDYVQRIDEAVLAGIESEAASETTRDRLFDLLMQRFELMDPHKAAIASILRAGPEGPLAALCGITQLLRSMAWTLEAAGIGSSGCLGRLRSRGLLLVYLATLRVWLTDDSPDMTKTLAALDRSLSFAEGWVRSK